MQKKQDYAGLSRTFDMYYPDVKQLVKETEQFYNSNYTDTERWRLTDYDNVRLIGTFILNKSDYDATLPRLYFKKEAEMTNPSFYIITRPTLQDTQERIIHIGTSVSDASQNSCSVSALTGGVVPHIEKLSPFSTYLKIMSYVKKYGYCTVYELQTGYEDICIKGVNGEIMPRERFVKQIFTFLGYNLVDGPVTDKTAKNLHTESKIWNAVVSFKTMVNTKPEVLDALAKLSEPVMKKYKEDQQEITVEQNGDCITFKFKNRVFLISNEEYSVKKANDLEKAIPTSAKILCQTGDTVYDKYTSYITHKLKAGETIDAETEKKFAKLQKKLTAFEQFINNICYNNPHIEYGNIYFGDLKHTIKSYRMLSDGLGSRISIKLGVSPSLESINIIADTIKDFFDLDPETKVILIL